MLRLLSLSASLFLFSVLTSGAPAPSPGRILKRVEELLLCANLTSPINGDCNFDADLDLAQPTQDMRLLEVRRQFFASSYRAVVIDDLPILAHPQEASIVGAAPRRGGSRRPGLVVKRQAKGKAQGLFDEVVIWFQNVRTLLAEHCWATPAKFGVTVNSSTWQSNRQDYTYRTSIPALL